MENVYWEKREGVVFVKCYILHLGKKCKITYYEYLGTLHKHPKFGYELYQGKNYIMGSNDPSYSRHWPYGKGLPETLKPYYKKLEVIMGNLKHRYQPFPVTLPRNGELGKEYWEKLTQNLG